MRIYPGDLCPLRLKEGMDYGHALFPCRRGGVGPERMEAHLFETLPVNILLAEWEPSLQLFLPR